MGTVPYCGDGIAAHLAWIRDELGSSGVWLVVTDRHANLNWIRRRTVADDLVAALGDVTSDLADDTCPEGSLEVTGIRVGVDALDGDASFLDLDQVHLSLTDPDDPIRHVRRIAAYRLPALWVGSIRRLTAG